MKKDLLAITDLSTSEIYDLFELAGDIKKRTAEDRSYAPLRNKTLAMVFQKPSARTRISFETGMYQLGGHAIYLGPGDIGMGMRESTADIARVLSRYNDGIMARLFNHSDILELAEYSAVPVINGLTDLLHPCQILSDLFTILERRGILEDLHVTYVGDGNNIANSWLNAASRLPFYLTISVPEGYDPDYEIFTAAVNSPGGSDRVKIERDPQKAVRDADVIYTDVWASMGQEDELPGRRKVFYNYQLNSSLLKYAGKNPCIMHCLPAHRGEEITGEVIDGESSIVFDQAENRLHLQKAILIKWLGDGFG